MEPETNRRHTPYRRELWLDVSVPEGTQFGAIKAEGVTILTDAGEQILRWTTKKRMPAPVALTAEISSPVDGVMRVRVVAEGEI